MAKKIASFLPLRKDHDKGYWFGSPVHLRRHALRKTAKHFLDLLFHTWRFLERTGAPVRHPLAVSHLQAV